MDITYNILPIQYGYIFNEPAKQIIEYLKQVPRDIAIRCALLISNCTKVIGWKEQIQMLPIDTSIKIECYLKMETHELELPGAHYVLFTPLTGIELLRNIFTIPKHEHYPIRGEWQRILIRTITLVNSTLIAESPKYDDTSFNLFYKSVRHFRYELDDRIISYAAVYRAMCLLDFLEKEQNNTWQDLLIEITKRLNFDTIKDYIKQRLYLLNNLDLDPKTKNQILRFKSDYKEIQKDAIPCIEEISQEYNKDYTEFKKRPFVQICGNNFAVIKDSFVANLIYNNLRFGLKKCYEDLGTGNAQGFFGLFNKYFVEQILFNRILKYSFNNSNKYTCFTEIECIELIDKYNKQKPHGAKKISSKNLMDGYVRQANKILLIECKGKIISLNALYNNEKLRSDVTSDIVGDSGTGQLIKNCERIIRRDCIWDDNIPKYSIIYPLLILDDIGFSANGFNKYVIEATKEFVDKQRSVFPFTVLDMDTFILISELIRTNKLNIFSEIQSYHKHVRHPNPNEQNISFATYLRFRHETRLPKEVIKWLRNLYQ